jgi:YfiH family protein
VFAYQDTQGPVEIAFTDRHRGTGGGPSASLDLATRGDADAGFEVVTDALMRGRPARGLVRMHQVHGAHVHVVDDSSLATPGEPEADALVTALPDVVLVVRVADCVPVVLADPAAGVVAVAHAGRLGMAAGVAPETVRVMRRLGAADITGWLGPHVCGACYEVPSELRADVSQRVPESFSETSWGTPSLDLGAGVDAQLRAAGVEVRDASRCTMEDDSLYSYRRQGEQSGRLAGLVVRRS